MTLGNELEHSHLVRSDKAACSRRDGRASIRSSVVEEEKNTFVGYYKTR